MKKRKILFIIWSFTYGGGAERVLATLANCLPKDKYDIDILEYWHADINNEKIDENVHTITPVVNSLKEGKVRRVLKMFALYFIPSILRKMYIKNDYDVEISFNYMIPTFLLRKSGKTIAWNHGDIYDLLDNKRAREKQRKALKKVDYIVAISENTYQSIIDVYPEYKDKVVIIHNSYDFERIMKLASEKEFKKDKKIKKLLYLGRFEDNKNPLYLLEVVKKLNFEENPYELTYIGKGELREQLEKKIQEYELSKHVKILDYQKNPYPYIQNADIILGCSKSEGFPTIFVEGMVLGKPFITTNVGGAKELSCNQQCGFVVKNQKDYIVKLKKLLSDDKLYQTMSNACKKEVYQYSCENQSKQVDELISKVLNGEVYEGK